MGLKYVIAVGDNTDHGGQVIEGDEGSKLFGKFPIAGKGHKVYCPQCKIRYKLIAVAIKLISPIG